MTWNCLDRETTIKFARVLVMSTSLTLATAGMLEPAFAKGLFLGISQQGL